MVAVVTMRIALQRPSQIFDLWRCPVFKTTLLRRPALLSLTTSVSLLQDLIYFRQPDDARDSTQIACPN